MKELFGRSVERTRPSKQPRLIHVSVRCFGIRCVLQMQVQGCFYDLSCTLLDQCCISGSLPSQNRSKLLCRLQGESDADVLEKAETWNARFNNMLQAFRCK